MMAEIRLDTPAASKTLDWIGNQIRLPIRSADTSGRLSGQLASLEPGSGNPPHAHTRESECFVVLEGAVEVRYGNREATLNAGDLILLPAGLPHQLKSSPHKPTQLLVLLTSGAIEDAFIEAAGGDRSVMNGVFAQHGVHLLDEYEASFRPDGFSEVTEDDIVIVRGGEGERVWLAGDTYTVMLSGAQAEDKLAVVHFDIPPGGGPIPHVHGRDFEAFIITEGEVELYADGAIVTGTAGDVAVLPENIPHCFKNRVLPRI